MTLMLILRHIYSYFLIFSHISSYFLIFPHISSPQHKPTIKHEIIKIRGNPKQVTSINKQSGNLGKWFPPLLCFLPPKRKNPQNDDYPLLILLINFVKAADQTLLIIFRVPRYCCHQLTPCHHCLQSSEKYKHNMFLFY